MHSTENGMYEYLRVTVPLIKSNQIKSNAPQEHLTVWQQWMPAEIWSVQY